MIKNVSDLKFCFLKTPCSTTLTNSTLTNSFVSNNSDQNKIQNLLSKWLKRSQNLSFVLEYNIDIFVISGEPSPEFATWLHPHHSGNSKNLIKDMHNDIPMSIYDIDFSCYNIVITSDCFVPNDVIQKFKTVMWCYYEDEHAYESFQKSRIRPSMKYDVFLNHYLDSGFKNNVLPQSISFPYLEHVDSFNKILTELNATEKKNYVFLDHYVFGLTNNDSLIQKIEANTNMKAVYSYKPSGKGTIIDLHSGTMPHVTEYLSLIGSCKYFLYMRGNHGIGQATLPISASKCIIIGLNSMKYAQKIMHPMCVTKNVDESINIINKLENDIVMKNEIIQYQLNQVNKHFWSTPLEQLLTLYNLKIS